MTVYQRQHVLSVSPTNQRSKTPIIAVLATPGKKDDGVNLRMSGARLERFRLNPALLVGHNINELPVGRVDDVKVDIGGRLVGRLNFASDPQAQVAEQRVRERVVNAVSVRFDVLRPGRDGLAEEWELLEVSLVALPLDGDAVITSRSRGRRQEDLGSRVKRILASELATMITGVRSDTISRDRVNGFMHDAFGGHK